MTIGPLSTPAARRGSMRVRITALATILVALVLGVTAATLVGLQRQQITANMDSSLQQRADAYEAALLETDNGFLLGATTDEDRAVQLATPSGEVVAFTPNVGRLEPLRPPLPPGTHEAIDSRRIPQLEDDSYRILIRRVDGVDGPVDLLVAQNIDDANDAVRALAIALGIAVPAVAALLAGLTWWMVGRTLRPVELIRSEVAHISGTDLHRRVPVSDHGDEISRLATTMNSMLDRVDTAARRQRQFVADASHELRTPLTRIRTEVEVDINHPGRADPAVTNRTVLDEAVGLQRLLEDLLFLARSDENQAAGHHRTLDLDDIVRNRVAAVRADDGIEIDAAGVSGAVVDGDGNQLARLVDNLLSNAVRHARSEVTVTLQETGQEVHLAVADDGPGVSAEAREGIFERFGRADDARSRPAGGAGLGLAIARDIVSRHGGTIAYDDGWGRGARFIVTLPPSSGTER